MAREMTGKPCCNSGSSRHFWHSDLRAIGLASIAEHRLHPILQADELAADVTSQGEHIEGPWQHLPPRQFRLTCLRICRRGWVAELSRRHHQIPERFEPSDYNEKKLRAPKTRSVVQYDPPSPVHIGPRMAGSVGRGERIRTSGPCLPKTVLYQAELLPDRAEILRFRRGRARSIERLRLRCKRLTLSAPQFPPGALCKPNRYNSVPPLKK